MEESKAMAKNYRNSDPTMAVLMDGEAIAYDDVLITLKLKKKKKNE